MNRNDVTEKIIATKVARDASALSLDSDLDLGDLDPDRPVGAGGGAGASNSVGGTISRAACGSTIRR